MAKRLTRSGGGGGMGIAELRKREVGGIPPRTSALNLAASEVN